MKPPLWTSRAFLAAGLLFILAPRQAAADCIKDPLGWACKCQTDASQHGCPNFMGPPNCGDPAIANSPACNPSGYSICDLDPCRIPCASAASPQCSGEPEPKEDPEKKPIPKPKPKPEKPGDPWGDCNSNPREGCVDFVGPLQADFCVKNPGAPACVGVPKDVGGGDAALGKFDWTKYGLDDAKIAVLNQFSDWKPDPKNPGIVCNEFSCQNVGPVAAAALGSHGDALAYNALDKSTGDNYCDQSPPPIPCKGAGDPDARKRCELNPMAEGCEKHSGDKEEPKDDAPPQEKKTLPNGCSFNPGDAEALAKCLAEKGNGGDNENSFGPNSIPDGDDDAGDQSGQGPGSRSASPDGDSSIPNAPEKAVSCAELERMGQPGACKALAEQIIKDFNMAKNGSIDVVFDDQVYRTVADTYDMFQIKDFREGGGGSAFATARKNSGNLMEREESRKPGFGEEGLTVVGREFDNSGKKKNIGGVDLCAARGTLQSRGEVCATIK